MLLPNRVFKQTFRRGCSIQRTRLCGDLHFQARQKLRAAFAPGLNPFAEILRVRSIRRSLLRNFHAFVRSKLRGDFATCPGILFWRFLAKFRAYLENPLYPRRRSRREEKAEGSGEEKGKSSVGAIFTHVIFAFELARVLFVC